ncbi:MAG: hypothetical protein QM820_30565 [Minicystis sp.]
MMRSGRVRDPLGSLLDPDDRSSVFYAATGVALSLHVAMLVFAIIGGLLKDIRLAVEDNRARLHEFFWRQYDVDLTEKKPKAEEKAPEPPPEPEPAPPPPPAPKAAPAPPKDDDPYKNLPAAPAKAAPIVTQKENPDEPKDLTDNTVVTGDGTAIYGKVSAAGTGDKPVLAPNVALNGVPGGKGLGTAQPAAPPAEDRSRAVGLVGGFELELPVPAGGRRRADRPGRGDGAGHRAAGRERALGHGGERSGPRFRPRGARVRAGPAVQSGAR